MFLKSSFLLETVFGDTLMPGAQLDLLISVIQLLQTITFTSLLVLIGCLGWSMISKLIRGD